ncbi:MAG: tetratricopeptide repeat protein [Paludibacteraceae bacterium]|nr:tetratricopeptide repeat protein [Paludibacteraceae bacterium]
MKKYIFILVLSALTTPLIGQSADTADRQFADGDYAAAMVSYGSLLKNNPQSPLYLYRYARCAQETGDYATAVTYFEAAGDTYKLKHFFAAECYFHLNKMEEAIAEYQTYLLRKPDTDKKDYVLSQIAAAEKLKRYLRRVSNVTLLDSTDIAKAELTNAYQLSPEAGTLFHNSTLYGYINQLGSKRIYAVGTDSCSQLVVQHSLIGGWESADTLPHAVNMGMRQNYPYCLSDGVTIYYASDHANGLGGLDIYVTRHNTATGAYTIPENIGLPFNSPANDYLYVLDETQGIGYWATDRHSAPDSVRIYKFVSTEPILWSPSNE